ncbi:MAG TPA: hypothetical protein VJN92_14870 [Candidatus Acidoferrum sp.]|nr:hypothetical protein [Candidatus Acidoferrum sp.]
MSSKDFFSWNSLRQKRLGRRNLIRGAAGSAAGAGLLLGSGLYAPAFGDDDEGERNKCKTLPRPIPHITSPPGAHFFFPGPPGGNPSDPHAPNAGFDPSTITDFKGLIANVDLNLSGKGTDLNTGESGTYTFHTDWRFLRGVFIGVDGLEHEGTLSFI